MKASSNYTALSWLARLGLAIMFALTLLAGMALSVVFFTLLAGMALLASGWLWWQTRRLRRRVRESQGNVIEGEYEIETESQLLEDRHHRHIDSKPPER